MEPRFSKWADGSLNLTDTIEATEVKESRGCDPCPQRRCWTRPEKLKFSTMEIQQKENPCWVFFQIPFGLFCRQTLRWVAEKALGYAAYLVAAKTPKDHAHNKGVFQGVHWALSFWQNFNCHEERAICWKNSPSTPLSAGSCCTEQHAALLQSNTQCVALQHAALKQHASASSLCPLLVRKLPKQKSLTKIVKRPVSVPQAQANIYLYNFFLMFCIYCCSVRMMFICLSCLLFFLALILAGAWLSPTWLYPLRQPQGHHSPSPTQLCPLSWMIAHCWQRQLGWRRHMWHIHLYWCKTVYHNINLICEWYWWCSFIFFFFFLAWCGQDVDIPGPVQVDSMGASWTGL